MADPKVPGKGEKKREKRAEKQRKKLDDVPPPGTDPLHEGP